MSQLARKPEEVRKLVRAIEAQMVELELLVLAEPTGYPREQLSDANIHFMLGVARLKGVS